MKRYILFTGDNYYAHDGALDLKADFDTLKEIPDVGHGDWWHIFDTETQEIVKYKNGKYCGQVGV